MNCKAIRDRLQLTVGSLNLNQAKLLASFCSDLAKGLILAGISAPFISRELLAFRILMGIASYLISPMLLNLSIELLEGFKNDQS